LHGNRQELNPHAKENSEAFSWEHEKANRAKHRDELYVLCANEGSQHDDEGWVMRRRCKRGGGRWIDDASWFESLEVNSILGKNWRHYSPSTGSVFIVVVC